MNITKSVQRIGWRFSQGKPFQPNQNDIQAYNDLVEYVQAQQREQIVDNVLFTKLYIYVLGEFLTYHRARVNEKIPQKELHRILATDMKLLIESFREKANNQELNMVKSIDDFKNYKEIDFKECVDNLRIMSTEAINAFSPKHLNTI